jgi:RNA polymerase sigma-70 factor, ECF subfamily
MVIGASENRVYAVFEKNSEASYMTFTQIVEKYTPLLLSYFARKIGRDVAHDLKQNTLLKAYRNSNRFDSGENFEPWLMTIAKRISIDYFRKKGRNREHVGAIDFDSISASGDLEKEVIDDQRNEILYDAIGQLSQSQQDAIKLHLLGYSIKEMVEELGIKAGAAKVRVHRAKERLGKILEDKL